MAKKEGKKAAKKPVGKKQEKKAVPKGKEDILAEEKKTTEHKAEGKVEKKPAQKNVVAEHAEKKEAKAPARAEAKFASTQELASSGIDTSIIFYPLITEKAVGMIESQNKLCFVVSDNANKTNVKKTLETMYGIKIGRAHV